MSELPKIDPEFIVVIASAWANEGGFIYSVQGVFRDGQWDAVHRENVQPLYWMPNKRLPISSDALSNGGAGNG